MPYDRKWNFFCFCFIINICICSLIWIQLKNVKNKHQTGIYKQINPKFSLEKYIESEMLSIVPTPQRNEEIKKKKNPSDKQSIQPECITASTLLLLDYTDWLIDWLRETNYYEFQCILTIWFVFVNNKTVDLELDAIYHLHGVECRWVCIQAYSIQTQTKSKILNRLRRVWRFGTFHLISLISLMVRW